MFFVTYLSLEDLFGDFGLRVYEVYPNTDSC